MGAEEAAEFKAEAREEREGEKEVKKNGEDVKAFPAEKRVEGEAEEVEEEVGIGVGEVGEVSVVVFEVHALVPKAVADFDEVVSVVLERAGGEADAEDNNKEEGGEKFEERFEGGEFRRGGVFGGRGVMFHILYIITEKMPQRGIFDLANYWTGMTFGASTFSFSKVIVRTPSLSSALTEFSSSRTATGRAMVRENSPQ